MTATTEQKQDSIAIAFNARELELLSMALYYASHARGCLRFASEYVPLTGKLCTAIDTLLGVVEKEQS